MTDPQTDAQQLSELEAQFAKTLSSHGHALQYRALRALFPETQRPLERWSFQAAEFPVASKDSDTRIDFLLMHRRSPTTIVVECKRANPGLSNWCFVRVPRFAQPHQPGSALIEMVQAIGNDRILSQIGHRGGIGDDCHLGFELRAKEKGDPCAEKRGAIDDAATQVLRGVAGYVEFLAHQPQLIPSNSSVMLIPVVLTTARLWLSNVDISDGDIATGNVDHRSVTLTERDFVALQCPSGPGITNAHRYEFHAESVTDALMQSFFKTVFIVRSTAFTSFLGKVDLWLS